MKRLIQGLTYSLACFSATAAPTVKINENLYEIGTATGLLSSVRSTIESQVWFGNSTLAQTLANEIGTILGTPNYGLYGPMFAHYIYEGIGADYTTGWVYTPNNPNLEDGNKAQQNNATAGASYTFAVGTWVGVAAVPEPSSILLVMVGGMLLLGCTRMRGSVRNAGAEPNPGEA